jgi:hypothetical protein
MTVRRPGKPLVVAARALGADSRKLVPKFSDDAAPSRRAEVSVSRPFLEWPSKSPEGRDSGRSAVSAGISVYAPFPTLADTSRIAKGGVIAAICRPDAPSGLSGTPGKIMLTSPHT